MRLRRVAGPALKDLAKEPLWKTVQTQPSAATFPEGESMAAMQARVVAAVRRRDAAVEAEHGPGAVWVAVSHGDIIKSVLADALGMHLDLFQRIHVDPASVSIVRYTGDPALRAGHQHPRRRPVLAQARRRQEGPRPASAEPATPPSAAARARPPRRRLG